MHEVPARAADLPDPLVRLVPGALEEVEDRGVATLKGIPGEWRLFAVVG
jgi:hypothetical protein